MVIVVLCAVAIILYGLTVAIAAFINCESLDWYRKKKPRVEAIRMRILLQSTQNDEEV